jgi:2-hydroxychromene-2-carboxylate isomerase
VLRAAELRSVDEALRAATAEAAARGVRATPAVWVAGEAFHGDEAVAAAAEAARGTVQA